MSAATPASTSSFGSSQRDVDDSLKFECPHCGKAFVRRENLSRHLKTHDAIKPHKCAVCQKEFTRSDLRQRHEATHSSGIHRQRSKPSRLSVNSVEDIRIHATPSRNRGRLGGEADGHEPLRHASSSRIAVGIGPFAGGNTEVSLEPSTSHSQPTLYPQPHGMQTTHPSIMLPTQFELSHPSIAGESSMVDETAYIPSHQDQEFALMNNWFDDDFYSALQETGTEWQNAIGTGSTSFLNTSSYHPLFREPALTPTMQPGSIDYGSVGVVDHIMAGRVSRLSSPPNEVSAEDQVAFAWNPRATQILTAKAITLSRDHQLHQAHDPRYDITQDCYERVRAFLKQSSLYRNEAYNLVMPELWVANIFIGLFFRDFEPQMPVIHRASLESPDRLPEYLIAIMLVIGAIYSGVKHTRRFAIVLLDHTRMSLHRSLELDNALMREPMAIYAAALICYTGLWCGNKRAFELAEVLRGSVITYCRRNHFAASNTAQKAAEEATLTQKWTRWVSEELSKRLCWVVYTLDCQFPALIYLPSTISLAELARIECPCDEEFWQASSARKWKRLLGPASVPPSKTFGSAMSPFTDLVHSGFDFITHAKSYDSGRSRGPSHGEYSQLKSLNSWTRFLVLMTLHVTIFQFSQQSLLAQDPNNDDSDSENSSSDKLPVQNKQIPSEDERWTPGNRRGFKNSTSQGSNTNENAYEDGVFQNLAERKAHLRKLLRLFEDTYLQSPPADSSLFATPRYFQKCTEVMHRLAVILLEVSVSDLQDSLGKSGGERIKLAMSNVSKWVNRDPQRAADVVVSAIRLISSLTPSDALETAEEFRYDTGAYEIIAFFLSTVIVWSFVSVARQEAKHGLLELLRSAPDIRDGPFFSTAEKTLLEARDIHDQRPASSRKQHVSAVPLVKNGDAHAIFRSGAEVLTRLGTWGASLNLALLLHNRAKM